MWKMISFDDSRDEKVISEAIELNEQLERVLKKHEALMSGRPTSTSNYVYHEEAEEEEAPEQVFRRYTFFVCCVLRIWNCSLKLLNATIFERDK